jgi:hypothetical protein
MSRELLKKIYISLALAACSYLYYIYITITYSKYISQSTLHPIYNLGENLYYFTRVLGDIVLATIVYLVLLVSTYFAIKGGQKERFVWEGLLLAFFSILLAQFIYYVFIVIILVELPLMKGDRIDFFPVKDGDNRIVIGYFMLYSVLIIFAGLVSLKFSFFGKALLNVVMITIPVILLLCCLIVYLVMRRNRWGYIMAVIFLLISYVGIFPRLRAQVSHAVYIVSTVHESGLSLSVMADFLKRAVYVLIFSNLSCLPSIIAIFLAIFILRRIREGQRVTGISKI